MKSQLTAPPSWYLKHVPQDVLISFPCELLVHFCLSSVPDQWRAPSFISFLHIIKFFSLNQEFQ